MRLTQHDRLCKIDYRCTMVRTVDWLRLHIHVNVFSCVLSQRFHLLKSKQLIFVNTAKGRKVGLYRHRRQRDADLGSRWQEHDSRCLAVNIWQRNERIDNTRLLLLLISRNRRRYDFWKTQTQFCFRNPHKWSKSISATVLRLYADSSQSTNRLALVQHNQRTFKRGYDMNKANIPLAINVLCPIDESKP